MKRLIWYLILSFILIVPILLNALDRKNDTKKAVLITEPILFDTPEADKILESIEIFPPNNPWNEDISERPVAKDSDKIIEAMDANGSLDYNLDMGFVFVPPYQNKVEIQAEDSKASDEGPFPIPDNAPIEPGSDRHVIVVDPTNMILYELFAAEKTEWGWQCGSAAKFYLNSNKLRTDWIKYRDSCGLTSADAAGLPIFPGVVKYGEVMRGEVRHALRVTTRITRNEYVYPATHFASRHSEKKYPRMGERLRLKNNVYIKGYPDDVQAILKALKKYGMFVADNGGNWRISVAPDKRFNIKHLNMLRNIKGRNFEVIVPTGPDEGPRAK